ncbi:MAG: hypothetical protein KatS3mg061_0651 [Dehalococcoidia bacterium]|nr:MAG: hypothetical protein KatS3mg061_0651 [Dehalococcoidia bacterium]
MPTRLAAHLDRLLEASWLMVAIVIPLFFDVFSARVFEPDKLTAFRGIMLFALAVWLLRELEFPGAPATLPRRWWEGFQANPLGVPVAVLALSYLISTIFSVQPLVSLFGSYQRLQGTLNNLLYFALFFLVATGLRTWGRLNRLVTTFILVSVPVSLYGWVQHFGLDPLPWGGDVQSRVAGSAGNPIFLGAYLILVIPFILARLITAIRHWQEGTGGSARAAQIVGYSLALVVNLVCLYWTGSRGPWMGFAASLVAMVFFLGLATNRRALLVAPVAAAAGFVALMAFFETPPGVAIAEANPFAQRLASIKDLNEGTNRVRLLIWFGDGIGKGAAGLVTDNIFRTIVGYGPETMYVAYNRFYPPAACPDRVAHRHARPLPQRPDRFSGHQRGNWTVRLPAHRGDLLLDRLAAGAAAAPRLSPGSHACRYRRGERSSGGSAAGHSHRRDPHPLLDDHGDGGCAARPAGTGSGGGACPCPQRPAGQPPPPLERAAGRARARSEEAIARAGPALAWADSGNSLAPALPAAHAPVLLPGAVPYAAGARGVLLGLGRDCCAGARAAPPRRRAPCLGTTAPSGW